MSNTNIRKQIIRDLYLEILGREPDLNGLTHYYGSNLSYDQIREILANSDEGLNKVRATFDNINFMFYTHNRKKDVFVSKAIFYENGWEPHISRIIVDSMKPNGLFVDIGANIGWHSKVVQNAGYDVIAFEPESENFKVLLQNCSKEGSLLKDIALGDVPTKLFLERDPENYGNTYVSDSGTSEVTSVRLDDVLDINDALRTNVVKIDVQGYETKIIQGGLEFFNNLQKGTVIITEISIWRPEFDLQLLLDVLHVNVTESYALCHWWNNNPVTLSEALEYISKQPKQNNLEFDLVIVK